MVLLVKLNDSMKLRRCDPPDQVTPRGWHPARRDDALAAQAFGPLSAHPRAPIPLPEHDKVGPGGRGRAHIPVSVPTLSTHTFACAFHGRLTIFCQMFPATSSNAF